MVSMRSVLTSFFAHRIEGTEPRIVELEQPIKIIGEQTIQTFDDYEPEALPDDQSSG